MGRMILNGKEYAGSGSEWHEYSTDEKVVGTWIDGKPLYEKVFELNSEVTITISGVSISQIDTSNMKHLISVIALRQQVSSSHGYGTVSCFPLGGFENGSLTLYSYGATTISDIKTVILQYTKTTDI